MGPELQSESEARAGGAVTRVAILHRNALGNVALTRPPPEPLLWRGLRSPGAAPPRGTGPAQLTPTLLPGLS